MQPGLVALSLVGVWALGFPIQTRAQARASGERNATSPAPASTRAFIPHELSTFSKAKAESLLQDRLPCLGCHQLAGKGGKVGPDLSTVAQRRSASYVRAIIEDPQHTVPGIMMPRVPMSSTTLDLIVNYLAASSRLQSSTMAQRPVSGTTGDTASGAATYARFCAACHGQRGGGDGLNAQNLPTRPTVHADAGYMSTRTNDELFDAISAGGFVMNRSNRMPPFGETISRAEIWKLVQYLRELCHCQGPAWGQGNK